MGFLIRKNNPREFYANNSTKALLINWLIEYLLFLKTPGAN